ncbi:MAG TPA: DUF4410 domain-containing protein [Verrucomicrobiota bacterium]|nr:DUF4410 domain-containing protein [Verrucomicrobiota bacterium]
MKKTPLLAPVLALAVLCGLGCQTAKVTSDVALAAPASSAPVVVYVADFELGADNIQHEEGVLSGRPGPVGRIGARLSGASKDPAGRARELVDLMADGLVKELSKAGVKAGRVAERAPRATQGWLVRGVFTEVQEGNRLRRAMIGFGQGQTDMQVVATIHDLSQGEPKPLYEVATDASSGSKPGAAPTLVLSPYGAAVRFVMAGQDLDRGARQTAARIAEQVLVHIRQANAK